MTEKLLVLLINFKEICINDNLRVGELIIKDVITREYYPDE